MPAARPRLKGTLLRAALAAELVRSASAGSGGGAAPEQWYNHEYEYNFVETLTLMVLVVLALIFESVWHTVLHNAEHSYRYGFYEELVKDGDEEAGGFYGEIRHLQLYRELVNRAGGEFMTLGFLAFLIYAFNQLDGFAWIAKSIPHNSSRSDSEWHYPESKEDWLHVAENVHMKLFAAMVFYFICISRMAAGGVARIKEWEQCRLRRFNPVMYQVQTIKPLKVVDESLADHLLWRRFFLAKMVRLQRRCPEMFRDLLSILELDPYDESFPEDFHEILDQDFSFSAYIALSVETGVRDSIQVHKFTWCVLLVGLGLLAIGHRFASISIVHVMPGLACFAVLCLVVMRIVIRHTRLCISRRVRDPTTLDVRRSSVSMVDGLPFPAENIPSTWSGVGLSQNLRFGEKHQTELIMLRAFQVVLFLISYVFSRTVLDFHDWRNNTQTTLLYTCMFAMLLCILAYDLPFSVPMFLGMMAMPPHVDKQNFSSFCAILLHGRDANRAKALNALHTKLTRGGTAFVSETGDTCSKRGDSSKKSTKDFGEGSHSNHHLGGSDSMVPRLSHRSTTTVHSTATHVHDSYTGLFRSVLEQGRERGLDEAEFLAGLALHLRRAVPGNSWPPRSTHSLGEAVPSEYGGLMDSADIKVHDMQMRGLTLEGIDEADVEIFDRGESKASGVSCIVEDVTNVLQMTRGRSSLEKDKVLHL